MNDAIKFKMTLNPDRKERPQIPAGLPIVRRMDWSLIR